MGGKLNLKNFINVSYQIVSNFLA